jgi:hypothetical protein
MRRASSLLVQRLLVPHVSSASSHALRTGGLVAAVPLALRCPWGSGVRWASGEACSGRPVTPGGEGRDDSHGQQRHAAHTLLAALRPLAPLLPVKAANVTLLHTPHDFFQVPSTPVTHRRFPPGYAS